MIDRQTLSKLAADAYEDVLNGKLESLNPFDAIADAVLAALPTEAPEPVAMQPTDAMVEAALASEGVASNGIALWPLSVALARGNITNWEVAASMVRAAYRAMLAAAPGLSSADEAVASSEPTFHAAPLATSSGTREIAWLVERQIDGHPHWYAEDPYRTDGWHDWVRSASLAKRFLTKAAAEAFEPYRMIASDPNVSLTEHVFIGAALPIEAPEPVATGEHPFHWRDGVTFAMESRGDDNGGVRDCVVIAQYRGPGVPVDRKLTGELVIPLAEWKSAVKAVSPALATVSSAAPRAWEIVTKPGNVPDYTCFPTVAEQARRDGKLVTAVYAEQVPSAAPVAWIVERDGKMYLPFIRSREEMERYVKNNPDERLLALYASPQDSAEPVKVKALEWFSPYPHMRDQTEVRAKTGFWLYQIWWVAAPGTRYTLRTPDGTEPFESLDAAKKAGQADYARRVRSELEPLQNPQQFDRAVLPQWNDLPEATRVALCDLGEVYTPHIGPDVAHAIYNKARELIGDTNHKIVAWEIVTTYGNLPEYTPFPSVAEQARKDGKLVTPLYAAA